MYYKWLTLVATDYHRRWQPLTEVLYVKLCWYDWTNHFSGVDRFRVQQSFCRFQKARWNRMFYQLTRGKQGSTPIRHQFSISFNLYSYQRVFLQVPIFNIRRSADKFLARHTSRCRRTESIVSLEKGVCSCTELQVFSCYRVWKEACQATRAISTTSRSELPSSFFSCKARRRRTCTPFWPKH